jgi:hypothetical protein|tara:strand:+ start:173 stop:730 length:558 start_codon:yes stop_codon:yes gene_type:complete
MEESLKQVYVPTVATPGGEKTQLGVFSSEQDAWDVMRAFLAKAGSTDVVHGNIAAWEIDFVGEEGSYILASFDRNNCPVCDELSFWVEGDDEKARCYSPRCGAWIEQNAYDPSRWDCGWPAANWNKRAEDYKQAYKGLVAMRGSATSAGHSQQMPSREAWLNQQDSQRQNIQQKKLDSMAEDIPE